MDSLIVSAKLEQKGIKPTANRILVYKQLAQAVEPMSLSDLERTLLSLDKSSIFRVLNLFVEHDVVHSFSDGRGVVNYELCGSDHECDHKDSHLHFYCESCHRSYCLREVAVADIVLPEGFYAHSASFVVKGICPNCSD